MGLLGADNRRSIGNSETSENLRFSRSFYGSKVNLILGTLENQICKLISGFQAVSFSEFSFVGLG